MLDYRMEPGQAGNGTPAFLDFVTISGMERKIEGWQRGFDPE